MERDTRYKLEFAQPDFSNQQKVRAKLDKLTREFLKCNKIQHIPRGVGASFDRTKLLLVALNQSKASG